MRRMVTLLPPPPLKYHLNILYATNIGSIVAAALIFPLCHLLPLAIVVAFCLPSGQKLPPMGTTFILHLKGLRPWIERGLKAMVLVGL
jgi:hypothetical protein